MIETKALQRIPKQNRPTLRFSDETLSKKVSPFNAALEDTEKMVEPMVVVPALIVAGVFVVGGGLTFGLFADGLATISTVEAGVLGVGAFGVGGMGVIMSRWMK